MKPVLPWRGVQTLLLLFVAFSSIAQWSTDPAVNSPVCIASNDQALPESISDGAGGVIVVWRDDRSGPANGNIFAQRFNAAGVAQWAANGIAICTAANSQTYPMIVSDGVGGAIIAWHDPRISIFNNDVYAQRVDASGTILWTANGVAISTAIDHQSFVRIASDGASGAIIAWTDQRDVINGELYAQRVSAAGVVQWAADGLPIRTGFQGFAPNQIIPDGVGGAIVSFYDPLGVGGPDPYVQRINASGTLLWGSTGVVVCAVGGSQFFTAIASDGANGVIISWLDNRSGGYDIYAQRVNGSGIVQWTANGVLVCGAADTQDNPWMVADGSGGAIMAWTDLRSGSQYDIYAQRVNAAGVMQWTADGVAVTSLPITYQYVPRILPDVSGGSLIAWTDNRNGPVDIYAQRLDGNGNPLWTANGVAISTATNTQDIITVGSDGASGMVICWEDTRGASIDIYTQRIPASGSLCFPPATPGTISGSTSVASGSNQVYSIVNDPTVTSYSWSLPSGWTGTSTANTINAVAGSTSGSISVTAVNGCGPSSPSTLSVSIAGAPVIDSFSPATGPAGTEVTITGSNFDPVLSNNTVFLSGTPATVIAASSTSLTVIVPAGAVTGLITVTTPSGSAESITTFLVICDPPCAQALIVFNAVSTNGDSRNDVLYIENIASGPFQHNKLTIFNRWGTKVFDATDYNNSTNAFKGLSNGGEELPSGTYYYTLEFSSGEAKRTGFISLRQ